MTWGREHQNLSGVKAIGVDEIAWQRGHRYLTLVYQIGEHCKRLLWVGEKRTIRTLLRFFHWFGKERSQTLKFVCSDRRKPYLKVIAKKADKAKELTRQAREKALQKIRVISNSLPEQIYCEFWKLNS